MFIRDSLNIDSLNIGLRSKWLSLEEQDILRIKKEFCTDKNHMISKTSHRTYFAKSDFLILISCPVLYEKICLMVKKSDGRFYELYGSPEEFETILEKVS